MLIPMKEVKVQKGKKYAFSKTKFITYAKRTLELSNEQIFMYYDWLDDFDNKEVLVDNELQLYIKKNNGRSNLMPCWCVER